jgi:predicted DsbA family dithiol-disulfide isomerase
MTYDHDDRPTNHVPDLLHRPRPMPRPGPRRPAALLLAGLAALVLAAGCGPQASTTGAVSAAPSTAAADPTPAAVIDGHTITIGDVDAHLQKQFLEELRRQPAQRIYEMRENAVRDLVQEHIVAAEAERLGKTPEEVEASIQDSVTAPTDEEIAAWYERHRDRVRGASLEDVRPAIEELLVSERRAEAERAFYAPKLAALDWRLLIDPPRQDLEPTRLTRGAEDAPVTLTVFSDYQCPYCVRAEPVLAEVLERYPDDVRLVHRHFPLDSLHPFARPAAEAAMCADEQGRFWAYHEEIFKRKGDLSKQALIDIGTDLGLDGEAFEKCVEERRYKDFVDEDFAAGRAAGVTGTPSFFVNGIAVSGGRSADDLSRQIELELARIRSK